MTEGNIVDLSAERARLGALTNDDVKALRTVIDGVMRPVLENIATAINQIAASQAAQADRLAALEKQVRLNTPVTGKMVTLLNGKIRERARFLLDARLLADDKKAVTKLAAAIRRDALARYGVSGLKEIPKHEYQVALSMIESWNNMLTVRDVARAAREK